MCFLRVEARGRGAEREAFREFQSGFVRLPAPELLLFCVLKREVAQRKEHPDATLSVHPWTESP